MPLSETSLAMFRSCDVGLSDSSHWPQHFYVISSIFFSPPSHLKERTTFTFEMLADQTVEGDYCFVLIFLTEKVEVVVILNADQHLPGWQVT